MLEAATAGVPAVAFDCPTGLCEIIDGGRTGVLVPPGDVGALAGGMIRLIEHPASGRRWVRLLAPAAPGTRWPPCAAGGKRW